jgi:hypothetical protein
MHPHSKSKKLGVSAIFQSRHQREEESLMLLSITLETEINNTLSFSLLFQFINEQLGIKWGSQSFAENSIG